MFGRACALSWYCHPAGALGRAGSIISAGSRRASPARAPTPSAPRPQASPLARGASAAPPIAVTLSVVERPSPSLTRGRPARLRSRRRFLRQKRAARHRPARALDELDDRLAVTTLAQLAARQLHRLPMRGCTEHPHRFLPAFTCLTARKRPDHLEVLARSALPSRTLRVPRGYLLDHRPGVSPLAEVDDFLEGIAGRIAQSDRRVRVT